MITRHLPSLTSLSAFFFLRVACWIVAYPAVFCGIYGCGMDKGGGEQGTEPRGERWVSGRGGVDRDYCGRQCRLGEKCIQCSEWRGAHMCRTTAFERRNLWWQRVCAPLVRATARCVCSLSSFRADSAVGSVCKSDTSTTTRRLDLPRPRCLNQLGHRIETRTNVSNQMLGTRTGP